MNTEQKNGMNNFSSEPEEGINIWEIALSLLGKLWLILLVAAMFAGIMWAYVDTTYVPVYTSSGTIFLVSKLPEEVVHTSDINYTEMMMNNYVFCIMQDGNMRKAVDRIPDAIREMYGDRVDEEELQSYIERATQSLSAGSLKGATSVSIVEDTQYLRVSVTATDRNLATAAANAFMDASLESLSDEFGVKIETIRISEHPRQPSGPSSSKPYKNVIFAGLVGALAVIAVLVLLYIRDDKINTSEDVERYLGLSVLSMIPAYEDMAVSTRQKKNQAETEVGQ